MYKITNANIKEWAKNYEGELFDGILCDPPYELGFMGKSWDSSGIAFDADMWADIYKLLKPGGHLLAFSGSRTYHRMAVAIEDAGFEIRDMIEWVYGSGFPKSLNIGKAVDRLQGNEREVVGINEDYLRRKPNGMKTDGATAYNYSKTQQETNPTITKGTSEWEGYGTALKPAHEPCVLARKPIDKGMTVAGNVLKHGTGGLAIDATRIGEGESKRFPANLIHDGSDEVEAVLGEKARYFYTSKASKRERNAGLEGFEERLGGSLEGGNDKRKGDRPQLQPTKNHHPTVKPLSLTKYLATLIKPPTGGRLLVPFSGSGSEMIGALQAGWEYVEGVELTEEYMPIAEARIKYWLEQKEVETEQMELI